VVGDRRHAIRRPRQLAEHLHEERIDPLREIAVGGDELGAVLEVEARVGPEELKELLDGALEARACLHGLHLGADACDLAKADRVHLVGRELRRRV
jgi:hypothetical protein